MSGITLDVILNDLKLISGFVRAQTEQKKWNKEIDKTKEGADKAEKEMIRMAEAVKKITTTPLEKYNRELAKLDTLQKAGKISAEMHTRAVALQRAELEKASTAAGRMTAATKQVGSSGLAEISSLASSLGMFTTAAEVAALGVREIGKAFQFSQSQAQRGAASMDSLFNARRALNQVAKSPEDLNRLITRADDGAIKYGVNRDVAAQILSDAVGGGFDGDFEKILAANSVVDSVAASKMTKSVLGIYGGRDKSLNSTNINNMTLAAAAPSNLTFEDLASGVAQASEGGAALGASLEETLAVHSVLGAAFKSGDTAADRMKGFGVAASLDPRLQKTGSFLGSARALRDNFSAEDREKFLGKSQELNVVYGMLLEFEQQLGERTQVVRQARTASDAGRGEIAAGVHRATATPEMAAPIKKRIAETRLAVAEERRLGVHGQGQGEAIASADAEQLEAGRSALSRSVANRATGIAAGFGLPGRFLPGVGRLAAGTTGNPFSAIALELKSAAEKMGKAADKMDAASSKQAEAAKKKPVHPAAQVEAMQPLN